VDPSLQPSILSVDVGVFHEHVTMLDDDTAGGIVIDGGAVGGIVGGAVGGAVRGAVGDAVRGAAGGGKLG